MTNTDKIRQLDNKVELAGVLAELSEIKEGITKEGKVPYVSFNGAIQCGTSPDMTVKFRTFVKSKKADGTESKIFTKVKDWAYNAVPLTRATAENPATMVDMIGSVSDNPYVSDKGELKEATQFSMQLINDFKEYKASIDLEGFIHSIVDETKGENGDVTGRQKMRLISRDFFRNTLDLPNIIIPEDLVDAVAENDYERGCTAKFYLRLVPNTRSTKKDSQTKGGIGVKNNTPNSYTYLEWVMTGADQVISQDDEKALSPKLIKLAMEERKVHLEQVVEREKEKAAQQAATPAPKKADTTSDFMDDEEFPF